jgi:hypothetical protein
VTPSWCHVKPLWCHESRGRSRSRLAVLLGPIGG